MRKIFLCVVLLALSQIAFAQTKIDEYDRENLADCDEHARLYNFTNELKNNPQAKGYVVIHKPVKAKTGQFLRHFYGVKRVLTEFMDVEPDRLQVVAGEETEKMRTEFWLVTAGEKAPEFSSISPETKLREPVINKTLFDYECIGCDPAVIIDFYIFREGLEYYAEALKANPNSKALIIVGKNEFVSKTRKERMELTAEIIKVLVENNRIERDRIEIKFVSGMMASLHIVPTRQTN